MPKIPKHRLTKSKTVESNGSPPKKEATIIWGEEVEAEDFIKVPRALLRLPQYQTPVQTQTAACPFTALARKPEIQEEKDPGVLGRTR